MSNEKEPKLPPFISIDDVLNNLDEKYDGQDIILSHEGCPLLTVRGTDDMSCMDDDEEIEQAGVDVVGLAEAVCDRYNQHEKLTEALAASDALVKELVEVFEFIQGQLSIHSCGIPITTSTEKVKEVLEKAKAQLKP